MKIKLGIYKRYKGKEYEGLGIAKHSETLEDLVIYKPLYEHKRSDLWVRPLSMFQEEVEYPRGSDKKVPRFEFISEK